MGNENDEIFYRDGCVDIDTLCRGASMGELIGVNASLCQNVTSGLYIPISDVINRTLSSEEFF